jgi:hypothetical protein
LPSQQVKLKLQKKLHQRKKSIYTTERYHLSLSLWSIHRSIKIEINGGSVIEVRGLWGPIEVRPRGTRSRRADLSFQFLWIHWSRPQSRLHYLRQTLPIQNSNETLYLLFTLSFRTLVLWIVDFDAFGMLFFYLLLPIFALLEFYGSDSDYFFTL